MNAVITLTTDFGLDSPDMLPGVIWKLAPDARVIVLTHEIKAHKILEGALVLLRCTSYFPDGTIHVAVVDPGVGTERRGLAARIGSQFFVGPDNGLFCQVLEEAEAGAKTAEIVALDRPEYWADPVNPIFHARDIFAPVAGHLARGVPLSALGTAITDPVRLNIPRPMRTERGVVGEIIYIDSFGNLDTNITRDDLRGLDQPGVRFGDYTATGIVHTFSDGQPGDLVALIDYSGFLEIALVNGNARKKTGARIGDPVVVG